MKTALRRGLFAAVSVTVALACGACTRTVSRGVNDAGVPDEVVFPDLDADKEKRAISPNLENLGKIKSGLGKRDIYYLLGAPHFSEILGAREWDYVFRFERNGQPVYCQYKIVYDKDARAASFYWKPEQCAALGQGR